MEKRSEANSISKYACHINIKLLPFKFHFFFTFGGFAAVIPFMPIIAKQLGINATALGIGFSMIPVFSFLSNPIIGFLVDFFQNIKAFLIVLLIASAVAYCSILSLPPIADENKELTYIRVSHFNDSEALWNFSMPFEKSCLESMMEKDVECKLGFEDDMNSLNDSGEMIKDLHDIINVTYKASEIGDRFKVLNNTYWVTFSTKDALPEQEYGIYSPKIFNCSPKIDQCSFDIDSNDIFSAYQFWAFFILAVLGAATSLSANSLSSVACYELLGTQTGAYGRQRLFGTISWGLVSSLSGMLNDLQAEKSFLSGIYLMVIFITIDVFILCVISLPKAHVSSSMGKDLYKIFSSTEILVFSLGIAFIGLLNAIIYVFEFWFLEDMGASRTLLGLSVFMQCLVGEVPFLFFSGWFVVKLGHFLCFSCVFCGFLLRLVFYYLLTDPWLVLPVDVLHGVTYGLYHVAMASFAKVKAPKGMEATLLGFFNGLYDGLGYGLGSFLGGFGLDRLGPRRTFFFASMLSLGCFHLFLVAAYVFRNSSRRNKSQAAPVEMVEFASNK